MVSAPNKSSSDAVLQDYTEDGKSVEFGAVISNIDQSGQGKIGLNYYVTNREDGGWQTIKHLNGPTAPLHRARSAQRRRRATPAAYAADLQASPGTRFPAPPAPKRGTGHTFATRKGSSSRSAGPPGPLGVSNRLGYGNGLDWGYSDDLNHIGLNGENQPYGPIFGPGVYEYVGTGDELPTRIDVNNAGEPISKCGPLDFTGSAAFGNAMSKDGHAAVFTATGGEFCSAPKSPPANEVWVRVDGKHSYDASESHCTRTAGNPAGPATRPAARQLQSPSPKTVSTFSSPPKSARQRRHRPDQRPLRLRPADRIEPGKLAEVSGARPKAAIEETAERLHGARRPPHLARRLDRLLHRGRGTRRQRRRARQYRSSRRPQPYFLASRRRPPRRPDEVHCPAPQHAKSRCRPPVTVAISS